MSSKPPCARCGGTKKVADSTGTWLQWCPECTAETPALGELWLEATWKMIEECANGTAIDERGRHSKGVVLTREGCAAFLAERQRRGPVAQALANTLESATRTREQAADAYMELHARTEYPSARDGYIAGWNTRAALEPPRAPPGTLEIGENADKTEVVMNLPHTPDNGTGWVYYAFTPQQAIDVGELFIEKARACQK